MAGSPTKKRSRRRVWWAFVERNLRASLKNGRFVRGVDRFLVVRHVFNNPFFGDVLLEWLESYAPEVRARFELHLIPGYVPDASRFALHIPWFQDPVQNWSMDAYLRATQLAALCDRRGIPVVNRVDRLTHAAKVEGAERIARSGLRTPRMVRISDLARFRETRDGLALPLFVRNDWGHGGKMLRADTDAQVRALPIADFARPIAVELVDVRDPRDRLFRKYRYVVAGDHGVALSMHVQKDWIVRGRRTETSPALVAEEVAYLERPNPLHAQLVAATRALELDFVAFDFSYDAAGVPIVWEANPFPLLHFGGATRSYRHAATTRVLAAMVAMYHARAGLPIPPAMAALVAG